MQRKFKLVVMTIIKDKISTIVILKLFQKKNGQVYIDYNGNHVVVPGNEVTIIEGMIFVDGKRVDM